MGQNGRMHRLRVLAPLVLLLALAAALAACGGSDLASDPAKVLADAKPPADGPTAIALRASVVPQAAGATTAAGGSGDGGGLGALLGGPIEIDATSQGEPSKGLMADATVTAGPLSVPVSLRENADGAWVQLGGQWYAIGQPVGLAATTVAKPLFDVATTMGDPKATAVEDVGGQPCDRITGTLQPGGDLAKQLGQLGLPIDTTALTSGQAQLSVWVARDDHVIRRIQIDSAPDGDGGLLIDLTITPSEVVAVQAPADAKPVADLLTGALGGQAGDGLGGLDLGALLGDGGGLGGLLGGATTGAGS